MDDEGNATVTTKDGVTATISAEQLVKDEKDVADKNNGENINLDFEKQTVADLDNLTDADKAGAKDKILAANPNVAEVIFDAKGNATVILKDGKTYTILAKDIFKKAEEQVPSRTASQEINFPEKVQVGDSMNLSDAEKETVKQALISANPKLKDANITIADNGEATIEYPDGQKVVISATDLVKAKETGNGSNGNTGNTDTNVDKSKLESGIQNLDRLIASELDKLDAAKAKEAKALLAEAKEVFAKANATQAEVDAMVKRLEEFKLNQASAGTDANAGTNADASSNGRGVNNKLGQRLANTGTTETNTGLAGLGMSILGGLLAVRRRKNDKN